MESNGVETSLSFHNIKCNEIFFSNFALRYKLNFYKLIPIFKWIILHIPNMSSSLYSIWDLRDLQHLYQYEESLKRVLFALFTINSCQSPLESSKVEEKWWLW